MGESPSLEKILNAFATRAKTVVESVESSRFCFIAPESYDQDALAKYLQDDTLEIMSEFFQLLQQQDAWDEESLNVVIKGFISQKQIKMPQLAQPLRIALTGNTASPGLNVTLTLLPKAEALARIERFLNS